MLNTNVCGCKFSWFFSNIHHKLIIELVLMLGAKRSYYCARKASLLCRRGGGGWLKDGLKHCQAKDCGGGVKGRRPASFSIPQFDCLFLRAPFQYSPFFWDKEPGPWGGAGGYFLK